MARDLDVLAPSRRVVVGVAALAGAAVACEYLPSVVALGQWGPFRTLPGDLCRWQGPRFPPRVALTFDDGPDPEVTPRVLDTLDGLGLRATFFLLGERVRRHPDVVGEVVRRGHQLATHGDEHTHHLLRSPAWVARDLRRANAALHQLGHAPSWYRPAYGQATAATLAAARALGLRTVLWSAWGREWASKDAREVASRVTRRLRPGAVVLFHDSDRFGPPGMSRRALDALPLVADELQGRRLTAVTMDDLVA
ncbi:MAG TPA: polysaccharide deacetylase family protein [Acidimicrobiales bacterium]|nr:polysaccharide deacetylase family protein [Acidimicrobiales bacterium]